MESAAVTALAAGVTLDQFWTLTPYETGLYVRAHGERNKESYKRALWAAWHGEAFQRMKQLPKLETLMASFSGKAKRATGEEILAAVKNMNKAFGGKDSVDG